MDDLVKNALKWLAINFGSRHPFLSTGLVMLLAGVVWVVIFKSIAAGFNQAPPTSSTIIQQTTNSTCSNIVVTGGESTCGATEEKPHDKKPVGGSNSPEKSH